MAKEAQTKTNEQIALRKALLRAVLETSQKIILSAVAVFLLAFSTGIIGIIFKPEIAVPLSTYMDSCKPVFYFLIAGYNLKAGAENVTKINAQIKELRATIENIETSDK